LINIHDVVVSPEFRGLGIAKKILSRIEDEAEKRGCCKLTLEVLEGNKSGRGLYKKHGFKPYDMDGRHGCALFWEKEI
jgi:ribosomal protein S18 acetylase RimI-like enzyme